MEVEHMDELKPCPFCGGEAKLSKRDVEPQGDPWYGSKVELFPECQNCACVKFDKYWHEGFSDRDEAITAWNTRATPPHKDG
jgi:C4-type Zn-finger protein